MDNMLLFIIFLILIILPIFFSGFYGETYESKISSTVLYVKSNATTKTILSRKSECVSYLNFISKVLIESSVIGSLELEVNDLC